MRPPQANKKTAKKATRRPASAAPLEPGSLLVGVVGVGGMGASIVACLLAAGHPVAAIAPDIKERRTARRRVLRHLLEAEEAGLLREPTSQVLQRLKLSADYRILAGSEIVIETIIEDLAAKHKVVREVEEICSSKTLIGSNTSALPITQIQQGARFPGRILGMHWSMPCHLSAFMEIIRGEETRPGAVRRAVAFGKLWGKEPAMVNKDIRGFIVNRIGYAMLREAFALVEGGVATPEDIDRALRQSIGPAVSFAGLFRYLDLTGLPIYATVMRDLLPDLDCSKEVPASLENLINSGARGISNGRGFYRYTPQEARRWEQTFTTFRRDIVAFSEEHLENISDSSRRKPRRNRKR